MPCELRAAPAVLLVVGLLAACHHHDTHGPLHWAPTSTPIAEDVDGDGIDDALGTATTDAGDYYLVAASGSDGHELWRSAGTIPAAEHSDLLGSIYGAVILPDKQGEIRGYDAKTGRGRFLVKAAGPIVALCARSLANTALFVTADKHVWTLDLDNGGITEISLDPEACVLLAGADTREVPGELVVRPDIPIAGTTVDHVYSRGLGPLLAFGHANKTPNITAFDDDRQQIWQVDIPASDPSSVSDIAYAAVDNRIIAVGYQHAGGAAEVTVFSRPKGKGKRLWTAKVGAADGSKPIKKIAIGKDAVFVVADGLESYDFTTGAKRWAVMK